MMNPSYPAGGGEGGGTPAPSVGFMRRRYLGSQRLISSGTWSRTAALALPFLAGIPEGAIEAEIECVGAGGSGMVSNAAFPGGSPGLIALRTIPLSDFLASENFIVGAGLSGSDGGTTAFGAHLLARGGLIGSTDFTGAAQTRHAIFSDRPVGLFAPGFADGPRGPGAGGTRYPSDPGGASCSSVPELRLEGGALGVDGGNGRDAVSPFQYGSGGSVPSYSGGANGGRGGHPGGGGASVSYDFGPIPGTGGRGEVRLHYYVLESVQ